MQIFKLSPLVGESVSEADERGKLEKKILKAGEYNFSRFPVEKQIVKPAIHHQKALLEKRAFFLWRFLSWRS